ncbi:MAG: c-type cytochrome [Bacteroidetes bacterium]|nr:c-type cytochrome [Bacteroidota bacterium]
MKKIIFDNISKISKINIKFVLTGILLLFTINGFSQANLPAEQYDSFSLLSNPLFLIMLSIILLLIIVIYVLGTVLVSVAGTKNRNATNSSNASKIISTILILLVFSSNSTFAQQVVSVPTSPAAYGNLSSGIFFLLLAVIVFELIIISLLAISIKSFAKANAANELVEAEEPSFFERINASVAIDKEEEILMDHNYDGIRELDNDLPPWWKYGFYFTILVAFLYMGYYYVLAPGNLQVDEYNKSMIAAKNEKAEFDKNNANSVNENNVLLLTDKAEIAKGQQIFESTCFACHGKLGEGGVGPNLTDDYWIHGGTIKNIFSTIKYGWPEKGMKSWQADLTPTQINEIASFIKTLHGSNPPNGKAPQGDLFSEASVQTDSLKKDSVQVILPKVDSAKAGHK